MSLHEELLWDSIICRFEIVARCLKLMVEMLKKSNLSHAIHRTALLRQT